MLSQSDMLVEDAIEVAEKNNLTSLISMVSPDTTNKRYGRSKWGIMAVRNNNPFKITVKSWVHGNINVYEGLETNKDSFWGLYGSTTITPVYYPMYDYYYAYFEIDPFACVLLESTAEFDRIYSNSQSITDGTKSSFLYLYVVDPNELLVVGLISVIIAGVVIWQ